MLNELAYCPRLSCLEWVQGGFAHSVDTIDGRFQHRRVDKPSGDLPDPAPSNGDAGDSGVLHARMATAATEGVIYFYFVASKRRVYVPFR